MEKFTLINKDRSRIKVFEPFEDVSNPSPSIYAMMISYDVFIKQLVVQLLKEAELRQQKTLEKNIKSF